MDLKGTTALVTGGADGIGAGIADVATEAGVRTAMDTAGQVGVLGNNAGGIAEPCFPAADPARWEFI
jgi:NADP-dependent 3-hydroxy acid dehydrogenase YdfG